MNVNCMQDMIGRLKRKYSRWLFKKYGFKRGPLFEKIPIWYKICPLWSPALYGYWESREWTNKQIAKLAWQRIDEETQNRSKNKLLIWEVSK